MDAIIISNSGIESTSDTSSLRLELDGRVASIQVVANYLENQGKIRLPIKHDSVMSWSSSPKLNGIALLSYLMKHDFGVALIDDYQAERKAFSSFLNHSPNAIIVSTTFIINKKALRQLIADIRSEAPDIFIIVGGPFVYASYRLLCRSGDREYETEAGKHDFLFLAHDGENEPAVDLYIIGSRNEEVLGEALRRIKINQALDDLPNVAFLEKHGFSFAKQLEDVSQTEDIEVDWENVPDYLFKTGVIPIQASHGCPFRCAYCNFPKDHRLMFMKPLDRLIAELKTVARRGARYVWFVDDNFRLGSSNIEAVCQRFIDEDLSVRWMSFIRASSLKDVDVDLLRRSGCVEVQLGLESAEPAILRNMNKDSNPQMYARVVQDLLSAGINCSCYFIFGFPGETDETARKTREFIKRIEHPELAGVLTWSIFPFLLAPLSPIYEPEMSSRHGLEGYMKSWKHRTMDSARARAHILQTFLELENSGIIYRDDNQDLYLGLEPQQRKRFVAARHRLSKLKWKERITGETILHSFRGLVPRP